MKQEQININPELEMKKFQISLGMILNKLDHAQEKNEFFLEKFYDNDIIKMQEDFEEWKNLPKEEVNESD